ncbi:plasmid mobilization relaxosome protein MobC [Candidatus Palauibacter sp.]|uniref:plasmid mobilization relaxosome protein MobC n=1 Tax=Candidatus Palauibacter sp. TaxID=3101350 RepID=UPI003B0284E9
MVRPRKPEAERRSRTICVRVTAAEIAARAGGGADGEGRLHPPPDAGRPIRMAAVHRLGAKERVELHRIGVNLNQIARPLNSGARHRTGRWRRSGVSASLRRIS